MDDESMDDTPTKRSSVRGGRVSSRLVVEHDSPVKASPTPTKRTGHTPSKLGTGTRVVSSGPIEFKLARERRSGNGRLANGVSEDAMDVDGEDGDEDELATTNNKSVTTTPRKKTAVSFLSANANDDLTSDAMDDQDMDELSPNAANGRKAAVTPSKDAPTPQRKQRRKSERRAVLPPPDTSAYERYFWANGPGRGTTSDNVLEAQTLPDHEQYFQTISLYEDPHEEAYEDLELLHHRSFPQWLFEFSQDFNICLYGYGSKRKLVLDFAAYLHATLPVTPKVLVVNGYSSTLSMRQVLYTLADLIFNGTSTTKSSDPDEMQDDDEQDHFAALPATMGTQPLDILATLLTHLTSMLPSNPWPIYIMINSLDALPLRRNPSHQNIFAQLAAHPCIHVLATCDTPSFPMLWDARQRAQFNWLSHDTTTFTSYGGLEIARVIDDVNDLLGRSRRAIKGRDGATFVLKSLTDNARNLYKLILDEALSTASHRPGTRHKADFSDDNDDDDDDEDAPPRGGTTTTTKTLRPVNQRTLYLKAVEDFICSNEMQLGQLLKEFFDHDMLTRRARRDARTGAEVLEVPFRVEECEMLLDELGS